MAVVIGAGGGGVFMATDTTITANTTLDNSKNWLTVGPITVQNGVTVTVNANTQWTVV